MAEKIAVSLGSHMVKTVILRAADDIMLAWLLEKDLKELQGSLESVTGLLQDAQEKETTNISVKKWLQRIKDAAYDAEDVLDDFTYEKLRREQVIQHNLMMKVLNFCSRRNPFLFRCGMSRRIKKINQTLDKIKKDGVDYRLVARALPSPENMPTMLRDIQECIPNSKRVVVGREKEVLEIVNLVVNASKKDQPLCVVPIVGMAGLGKTTLAKEVCKKVKGKKIFDVEIWVCVSNSFDTLNLCGSMLEYLDKTIGGLRNPFATFDLLQNQLKNRKFLLVLDDVWNEDESKWAQVREGLLQCTEENGNCVVMTTRSAKAAEIMEPISVNRYCLEPLTHDQCWTIIKDRAWGKEEIPSNLEGIGKQIAEKCKGLPLVADVLGATMNHKKTEEAWSSIQKSNAWNETKETERVLKVLKLSFDRLPSTSYKQCFTYCALFPKDYVMKEEKLIRQWISQGYFQQHKNKNHEQDNDKDIGKEHFNFLLANSFFIYYRKDTKKKFGKCMMHDVMHDLAQYISGSWTWMHENEFAIDASNIRMLNISKRQEMLDTIGMVGSQKLRVLLSEVDIFSNMKWNFRSLRALDLSNSDVDELPLSIGKSKHLRFLDISYTSVSTISTSVMKLYNLETLRCRGCRNLKQLPMNIEDLVSLRYLDVSYTYITTLARSITKLYYLETLRCKGCHQLEELPEDMQDLVNLIYLDVSRTKIKTFPRSISNLLNLQTLSYSDWSNLEKAFEGGENLARLKHISFSDKEYTPTRIGKLTSLEILSLFEVRREEGHQIKELGNLSRLRGGLSLSGLESVSNKEEALKANLKEKPHLSDLEFLWSPDKRNNTYDDDDRDDNDEDVLEGLQPHSNIQHLKIRLFMGKKFPDWCSDHHVLACLVKLTLSETWGCIELPTLGELPSLEDLKIQGTNIGRIGNEFSYKKGTASDRPFPSLKYLELERMRGLEEWGIATPSDRVQKTALFPCLEKLTVGKCPKLKCLPHSRSFPSLKSLVIYECGFSCLSFLLQECQSLQDLSISSCDNLTSIPGLFGELTSLIELEIRDCRNLKYFNWEEIALLSHLQSLLIMECPQLIRLPNARNLASLKSLRILRCGFSCLSLSLQECTSLEDLTIQECENLTSISGFLGDLTSIIELKIRTCHNLKYFTWDDIALLPHIQSLCINNCPQLIRLPNVRSLTSLKSLWIFHSGLSCLSTQLQECKSLEDFSIGFCDNLTSLPGFFGELTSLIKLDIVCCPSLKYFTWEEIVVLSHLKSLHITNCPQLIRLPNARGLPSLTSLKIKRCGFSCLSMLLQECKSLSDLTIAGCNNLMAIPDYLGELTSLTELSIYACPKLTYFPWKSLSYLTRLKSLSIGGFSQGVNELYLPISVSSSLRTLSLCGESRVKSLPHQIQNYTSLQKLHIREFEGLEALPEWLGNLSSLHDLSIWNCGKLKYLPPMETMKQGLSSLQKISIERCPHLQKRCKEGGEEWVKILHIPLCNVG